MSTFDAELYLVLLQGLEDYLSQDLRWLREFPSVGRDIVFL